MSVTLQAEVWRLALPANQMLVALALADHGDDDGTHIFPSISQLAWKTGYSERQVQAILRQLETRGLLIAVRSGGGRGRATLYRMDTSAVDEKPPRQYGANIAPITAETVQSSHPNEERVQSSHPNEERVQFATERVQFATERVQFATNRSIGNHHITIREPVHTRAKANGVTPETAEAEAESPPVAPPPPLPGAVLPELPDAWRGGGWKAAQAYAQSARGRAWMLEHGYKPQYESGDFGMSAIGSAYRALCDEQGLDCRI